MVVTAMSAPPRRGLCGGLRRYSFDRGEALAFGLDREHRAALHRLAVDEDRARPALAGVASDMGAREAGDVPYVMHEQQSGLDLILVPAAIDGSGDLVLHTFLQPW